MWVYLFPEANKKIPILFFLFCVLLVIYILENTNAEALTRSNQAHEHVFSNMYVFDDRNKLGKEITY